MKEEKSICPICGAELEMEREFSYQYDSGDRDTPPSYNSCLIKISYDCPDCDYHDEENFADIFEDNREYEPCKD